jgi:hypothetical protein
LLEEDLRHPESVRLRREQSRIEEGGLAFALASAKPVHKCCHRRDTDREQGRDGFPAFLPDEHTDDEPPHADHGEDCADDIDGPITRIRHVADASAPHEDGRDDQSFEQEADAPGQDGRYEPADQRSDGGSDRASRPDQREDARARALSSKLP